MILKIKIQLSPLGIKNPIKILHSNNQHLILTDDRPVSVIVSVDYNMEYLIDLFCIENFSPGTGRVTVTDISINDVQWKDWQAHCGFKMQNNLWVDNRVQLEYYELSFNGCFFLDVRDDRDRFCWFQFYHSAQRSDFVFDNVLLDCDSPYNCYNHRDHLQEHQSRFENRPYHAKYKAGDAFRYGCFGCSFTAGEALLRGQEWPALLAEHHSVINLGHRGVGVDTIFLNLSRALETFQIERVIILFPNLDRRLCRFSVDGEHFRMPITVRTGPGRELGHPCFWFSQTLLNEKMRRTHEKLTRGDGSAEYSRRVIVRTVGLLERRGVPYWASSWDTDTYAALGSAMSADHLLPFFPNDRNALDGKHSSSRSQRAWLEQIRPIVNS